MPVSGNCDIVASGKITSKNSKHASLESLDFNVCHNGQPVLAKGELS